MITLFGTFELNLLIDESKVLLTQQFSQDHTIVALTKLKDLPAALLT